MVRDHCCLPSAPGLNDLGTNVCQVSVLLCVLLLRRIINRCVHKLLSDNHPSRYFLVEVSVCMYVVRYNLLFLSVLHCDLLSRCFCCFRFFRCLLMVCSGGANRFPFRRGDWIRRCYSRRLAANNDDGQQQWSWWPATLRSY
jgi:hypothetical protein